MREDLQRLFHISAKIELKDMPGFVLTCINPDKLKSEGGNPETEWNIEGIKLKNLPVSKLIGMLDYYFLEHKRFVLDSTKIRNEIDIDLSALMIDIESVKKGLSRYGLILTESFVKTDVLVIDDKAK
jgi:hypothetical protein